MRLKSRDDAYRNGRNKYKVTRELTQPAPASTCRPEMSESNYNETIGQESIGVRGQGNLFKGEKTRFESQRVSLLTTTVADPVTSANNMTNISRLDGERNSARDITDTSMVQQSIFDNTSRL